MRFSLGSIIRLGLIIWLAVTGQYELMILVIIFSVITELQLAYFRSMTEKGSIQTIQPSQEQKELLEINKNIRGIEKVLNEITEISQDQFSNIFSNLQEIKVLCSRQSRENARYSKQYNSYLDKTLSLIDYMLENKKNWVKTKE